jgi:hypothetical protein
MPVTTAAEAKEYRLRTVYKQTVGEHNALRESQGNKCPLCDRSFKKYMAYQDHDHLCCSAGRKKQRRYCGKCCRGLLCFICNKKVIGALEYIEKLGVDVEKAMKYLRDWHEILIARGAYESKAEVSNRKRRNVPRVLPSSQSSIEEKSKV